MKGTFKLKLHNSNLHGKYWTADEVKSVVVLIHGLGEHMQRYEKSVIKHLAENGFPVVACDLFGHGKSEGKRGYASSYNALLDLVGAIIDKAQEIFPNKNIILYGHSLGGNLVINYVLRRQTNVKGIILSSPFLKLAFQPPKWKVHLGKLLLKFAPKITLSNEIDPSKISREPNEVKRYLADPLIHNKVSPIYAFPIMDAGKWAIENANHLKIKTLVLHGTGDNLIDYNGSKTFVSEAKLAELKLFENGYHELHHDLCRKEFIETVLNWLNKN
jgi:alpha-beta hydrolase superfamily lysophospholipase